MFSCDTYICDDAGNLVLSQPEICEGDHSCRNFLATKRRSLGSVASLQVLGRCAAIHARVSAADARYKLRPPFRMASRLTVDGALPMSLAIARSDRPWARPREMSSR